MSYPHSSDSSIVAPVQDEVLPADNQYNISFFKALKPGEVTIYVPDNQACADSFKNCGNLQISFKVIVQG